MYGRNDCLERRQLWRHLIEIEKYGLSVPWIIQADFNVIRNFDGKMGSEEFNMRSMEKLNDIHKQVRCI